MDKKSLRSYTDLYATYMRIKSSKPRQDYTVVLLDEKDAAEMRDKDSAIQR